jgi:hypothetical protein
MQTHMQTHNFLSNLLIDHYENPEREYHNLPNINYADFVQQFASKHNMTITGIFTADRRWCTTGFTFNSDIDATAFTLKFGKIQIV